MPVVGSGGGAVQAAALGPGSDPGSEPGFQPDPGLARASKRRRMEPGRPGPGSEPGHEREGPELSIDAPPPPPLPPPLPPPPPPLPSPPPLKSTAILVAADGSLGMASASHEWQHNSIARNETGGGGRAAGGAKAGFVPVSATGLSAAAAGQRKRVGMEPVHSASRHGCSDGYRPPAQLAPAVSAVTIGSGQNLGQGLAPVAGGVADVSRRGNHASEETLAATEGGWLDAESYALEAAAPAGLDAHDTTVAEDVRTLLRCAGGCSVRQMAAVLASLACSHTAASLARRIRIRVLASQACAQVLANLACLHIAAILACKENQG